MSDNVTLSSSNALPAAETLQTVTNLPDYFLTVPAATVSKLDADHYIAEDLHGATESLFGSGNMNFLLLQAGQTNEALNATRLGALQEHGTFLANSIASTAFNGGNFLGAGNNGLANIDATLGNFSAGNSNAHGSLVLTATPAISNFAPSGNHIIVGGSAAQTGNAFHATANLSGANGHDGLNASLTNQIGHDGNGGSVGNGSSGHDGGGNGGGNLLQTVDHVVNSVTHTVDHTVGSVLHTVGELTGTVLHDLPAIITPILGDATNLVSSTLSSTLGTVDHTVGQTVGAVTSTVGAVVGDVGSILSRLWAMSAISGARLRAHLALSSTAPPTLSANSTAL